MIVPVPLRSSPCCFTPGASTGGDAAAAVVAQPGAGPAQQGLAQLIDDGGTDQGVLDDAPAGRLLTQAEKGDRGALPVGDQAQPAGVLAEAAHPPPPEA